MKIYLASDHAGLSLRNALRFHVQNAGYDVFDLGPNAKTTVDYPDFAVKLAMALKKESSAIGIGVCGSGIGMSIALNRFFWIRAALVTSPIASALASQHNNANVLVFGERLIDEFDAKKCVDSFLANEFEGGRHQRRVKKLFEMGKKEII